MKKFLFFLVLMTMCVTVADAQRYFIPKYKRKKEVREYTLDNMESKWSLYLGGYYDLSLGVQYRVHSSVNDYTIRYNEAASLKCGVVHVGGAYRVNENIQLGMETGLAVHEKDYAIPMIGVARYYDGPAKANSRGRLFNYVTLGPQFFLGEKSKTIGAAATVGGGVRVLIAKSLRTDIHLGYQLCMRRPTVSADGKYDVPASNVNFKEYTHSIQVGMNIIIF